MQKKLLVLIFISLFFTNLFSVINSETNNELLKIYLESGSHIDKNYMRRNIDFVQFVNDRFTSDFHIMVNKDKTGPGGKRYQIILLGKDQFSSAKDTLTFETYPNQSDDQTRRDMLQNIKAGLVRYATDAGHIEKFDITPTQTVTTIEEENVDKWNNWSFKLELEGDYDKEKSQRKTNFGTSFQAKRVTKQWKSDNDVSYNYEYNKYITDTTITAKQEKIRVWGELVKSIGNNWSIGGKYRNKSSTYSNLEFSSEVMPAIEYNIFPYSQSSNKFFTINYGIGYKYNNYIDTTIFGKMRESMVVQELNSELKVIKPWGEIDISLEAQTYIPDFEYNHISLSGRVSFNLTRGFSVFGRGKISRIEDQIHLPLEKGETEDVLLEVREQATDYSLDFRIGIVFNFGSIYNSVVNPRFTGW